MDTRDAVVAKLKAQLDEWNLELDQLEARANKAQTNRLVAYNEHLATLKQYRDDAQQRLGQLEQASGNAWEDMTQGMNEAWASIGKAFASARAQFDEVKSA